MEIKVYGPGCSKCKTAYNTVKKVVEDTNSDATVTKVEDMMEMMEMNILATPAIAIDGVVKISGRVPSESDVKNLLGK
ncbi:MAG: thioredoxin family protein [bacterium]